MDEEQRARVDSLLEEALSRTDLERDAFLAEVLGEDQEVGREVSSLLRCHEQAGPFLETPIRGFSGVGTDVSVFARGEVVSDRFRIVELRDRGGMGEVYEAFDLELGERVALKTIRSELAWDESVVERFRREALLARRVTHRNVCRIHDVFHVRREESEDVLFLTMEYLEGENLASYRSRQGPIDWREAIPILSQILSGLEAACSVGVLHRDLKAENVMLVPEAEGTRAVVTDFGLAALADGESSGRGPEWRASSRSSLGTPAYMSPEQLDGSPVDHRSDIYAVGVIAYEMLSGEFPYPIVSGTGTLRQRFGSKPRGLREFQRRIPREFERSILQSLEVKPSARPAGASELRRKLQAIPTEVPARRVALLAAASAAGGAFALVKVGPRVLEALERWALGPRILPLEKFVDSAKALAALRDGLVRVRAGANLSAIPYLKSAVGEAPHSAMPRILLMDVLLNVGEQRIVNELGRRIRDTFTDSSFSADAELGRAVLARADGEYAAACGIFETLVSVYPEDVNLALSCARAAEEAGDIPKALRLYENARRESLAAVLGLGRCLTITGEPQTAIDTISSLLASSRLGESPEVLGMAHSIIGIARRDQGLPSLAVESFERALAYRKEASDRRGQVASMSHLGSAYRQLGRLKESIAVLQDALPLSRMMEDRIYESQVLYTLARSYDLAGRTEEARVAARQSLTIELARDDHAEIPQRLTFLSGLHRRKGQYAEAQVLLDQGQEHTDRSGDREVEAARLFAWARVLAEQGRNDEAAEVFARMRKIIQPVRGQSASEADIALAAISDSRGKHAAAEKLGFRAVSLLEAFHKGPEFAAALTWKTEHLASLGRFRLSRETARNARDCAQRLQLREMVVSLTILDAETVGFEGALNRAVAELESVLSHTVDEFAALFVRARLVLGRIYWRLGDSGAALDILNEAAGTAATAGMMPLVAATETALSEILLRKDRDEANERARRALNAAEPCGALPLLRAAAANLAEASAALGRVEEARKSHDFATRCHAEIVANVPQSALGVYLQHPRVVDVVEKLARLQRLL